MGDERTLYLVRHGQTDWNLEGKWQGFHGPGLNENGKLQASRAAEFLVDADINSIYSSDIKRAMETADIISRRIGTKEIFTKDGLRERDLGPASGPFVGRTNSEILEKYPEIRLSNGVLGPNNFPQVENWNSYVERCWKCFNEIFMEVEGNAAVVTHGGVILVIASRINNDWNRRIIPNCGIAKVTANDGEFSFSLLDYTGT